MQLVIDSHVGTFHGITDNKLHSQYISGSFCCSAFHDGFTFAKVIMETLDIRLQSSLSSQSSTYFSVLFLLPMSLLT